MGGGAWPFLVGGVICLLNCDNERDLDLLNSQVDFCRPPATKRCDTSQPMEERGNNRSVMPLDVLGRTRATLTEPRSKSLSMVELVNSVQPKPAGDRALQLLLFN